MQKNSADEMSFLDHLEVLRWHLVRGFSAIFIFAAVAFIYKQIVFDLVLLAPKEPDFPTYVFFCKLAQMLHLSDDLCFGDFHLNLINIDMSGQFTMHIMVSLASGLVLAFPYILWEVWRFIKPALHNKEKRHARGLVFYGSVLFMLGILFGYYVITPLSVNFLGNYQVSETVQNQITLTSFISTVVMITLSSGVVFEMPILVYFLTKIGLITPDFLRKYRRHAIVVNLALAAILTPPDVTSQILMAIPLMTLYQVSIWVSAAVHRKQEAAS